MAIEDEFDFTTRKIYENFSNYSAWHRRTLLLFPILEQLSSRAAAAEFLKNEVEMCRNAAWTAPADQSVWFYQRWFFFCLPRKFSKDPELMALIVQLSQEQLESILKLLDEEQLEDAEAVQALAFVAAMMMENGELKQGFLSELVEIDPKRSNYWKRQMAIE